MTESEAIVERLKQFLAGGAPVPRDELVKLSTDYSRACAAAVRRLGECGRLLARGQGSEAIYQAEAAPPLLDELGVLEFAGADAWRAFAAANGLDAPPPFEAGPVKLLDAEYSKHQSIEPLVSLYRKLAVKQGPLTQRLALLRRLRDADPDNPNWQQDLGSLEAARYKEVAARLRRPADVTETEAEGFVKDLTADNPAVRATAELVGRAAGLVAELKARRFAGTVRRIAGQAIDAYAAMDLPTLEGCLVQVDRWAEAEGLTIPPDVAEDLVDARAWAGERQERQLQDEAFASACGELTRLLDDEAPHAQLSRALAAVEAFGRDVPDSLPERARSAVFAQVVQERRRRAAVVAAAAVVVLAVVAGVGLLTRHVLDGRDRDAVAAQVSDFAQRMDFAGGRRYVEQVRGSRPGRLAEPPVAAAVAQLEAAATAEDARARQAAEVLGRLAPLAYDDPAYAALAGRAAQLARLPEEKGALELARAEAQARVARRQKGVDDQLAAALTDLAERYATVRALSDPAAIRAAAADMDAALRPAEAQLAASRELRAQVANYRTLHAAELNRATAIAERAERDAAARDVVRREIDAVPGKLPSLSAYLAACEDVAARHAAEPSAPEPAKWRQLVPHYAAVLETSRRTQAAIARRTPAAPGDPLAECRDALDGLAADVPTPYAGTVEALRRRAAAAAAAAGRAGEAARRMNLPVLAGVSEFELRLPERPGTTLFYCLDGSAPVAANGGVRFTHFNDQHGLVRDRLVPGATVVRTATLAPHAALARELATLVQAEQSAPGLHSLVPEMVGRCAAATSANPKARAMLLAQVVAVNDAADNPVGLTDDLRRSIAELDAEDVNFLTPGDSPKAAATAAAQQSIARRLAGVAASLTMRAEAAKSQRARAAAEHRALFRPLGLGGIVWRGPDGRPSVRAVGAAGAREYWVIEVPAGGEPRFAVAATVARDGTVRWSKGYESLPLGCPLLSPEDRLDTVSLAAAAGVIGRASPATVPAAAAVPSSNRPAAAGARGWPVNLAALPGGS